MPPRSSSFFRLSAPPHTAFPLLLGAHIAECAGNPAVLRKGHDRPAHENPSAPERLPNPVSCMVEYCSHSHAVPFGYLVSVPAPLPSPHSSEELHEPQF